MFWLDDRQKFNVKKTPLMGELTVTRAETWSCFTGRNGSRRWEEQNQSSQSLSVYLTAGQQRRKVLSKHFIIIGSVKQFASLWLTTRKDACKNTRRVSLAVQPHGGAADCQTMPLFQFSCCSRKKKDWVLKVIIKMRRFLFIYLLNWRFKPNIPSPP